MTNPAYEATNSDVVKLISDIKAAAKESKELSSIARYKKGIDAKAKFDALATEENVLALIAALEQAQQENKSQLAALTNTVELWNEQRTRIAEIEYAPNGMMQLSNELAKMKQTVSKLRGERDELLRYRLDNMESRPLCVKSNDVMREAAPLCVKLPAAATDVLAERHRQITSEGWSPEHDDEHDSGEMAGAAACYARYTNSRGWIFKSNPDGYRSESEPHDWPWSPDWWKPTDPRRDLVKAGALIIAEIERIDRAAGGTVEGND